MKAAFEKAMNAFGGYARGNQRRQDPSRESDDDYQLQPAVIFEQDVHSPALSVLMSSDGSSRVPGGDDAVLYSKNNVLLKQPKYHSSSVDQSSKVDVFDFDRSDSGQASSCSDYRADLVPKNSLDNHILIPGFLFVTTRGSNFGTTLILNWAPNSSMKVPKCDSDVADNSATATSSLPPTPSSSVSINLCSMEMIRIFYRMDDSGFIISGELVVKSKEENFEV